MTKKINSEIENVKEMCDEIKIQLKKFSKNNNIYRALLYDYNLFCKDNEKVQT